MRVLAVIVALVMASVLLVAVRSAPPASVGSRAPSPALRASATPAIWYNYSDFFNVPYGEWWDMRTNYGYGDEPVGASCFNATSVATGTCTRNLPGLPRVSHYPYMDWAGSGVANNQGSVTNMWAPYRLSVAGYGITGYNLSQPVFLPVTNYNTPAGASLSFNWNMQYLTKAQFTQYTSTLSCYSGTGAMADDGYQLVNKISLSLDNQEAARLFGAPATGTPSAIQGWWSTAALPGCGMGTTGKNPQAGPLETAVNAWFQDEANGKYDVYNGYAAAYMSLFTNITATVVSGGPTGTTHVYIEHAAWGTEILLDRWWYWGNATYAGNQANSGKAAGWWGMENGWWEGVHYAGSLGAATMNFNLNGVLQYHMQERSAPGADGVYRSSTNLGDSDDTPYWIWGPQLVDYVFSSPKGPYSEMDRYAGLNYFKTTPGSGDYGTNTSFDYTPISWAAKTGEWWNFKFPTNSSAYYHNPATAPLGTDPFLAGQLPNITSTLSLKQIYPYTYGTWNAATGTWSVTGGTPPAWPPSTGPGTYPYVPFPNIQLQPSNFPPVVTTDPASAIGTTTATLNGRLNVLGSAPSVSVGFLWGTSPTLATSTNVTSGTLTSPGPFSSALASLTPGTTYYFQAWALGASFVKGAIVSFTAGVYPPAVTTNAASGVTTAAATLNGALTDLGSATSVSVGFLWGTSPTLTAAANITVGTRTAIGTFNSVLASLTPGTTYYFAAWALGSRFVQGSIVGFATASPPVVATTAATGITSVAAILNGDLTGLGSTATVTVGFLWGTSPTLVGAANVTVGPMTMVGTFNSALSGLTPATTYYFEAWANGGAFALGGILSFTTLTVPPAVITDAATSVTPTAAMLNGHTTSLGSAGSVSVGFLWGTSPTLVGAANASAGTQTAAGAFSSALTGLTSGTTYYVAAWALGAGFVQGSILSFTATVTPPVVTTDPASSIGVAGATINGNLVDKGSAASVSVGFLWGTDPTLVTSTNTTVGPLTVAGPFSHALLGLTPGTTYYFEAWGLGDGFAHGSILNFKTGITPPSVTTSGATTITTSAATLNGDLTSLGTAASVEVGFYWGTSATLAGAANVSKGAQTAIGTFSHALAGLTPGTTYYFEAWANGAGFATGGIVGFTTAVTPPSVTTNAATSIRTTGATLNGATSSLGTAASVSVGFVYGTSATLVGATNASAGSQTVAAAFSLAVAGLTPGTTYYVAAWALGDGFVQGATVSFATATPPSVTTDAASGITLTAATLNGHTTSLGSASSVDVGFLWGTSFTLAGAANVTVATQAAAAAFLRALSGLTPSTTYYFQAWANGSAFVAGSIVSFATPAPPAPPSVTTNAASAISSASATLNGATTSLGTAGSVSVGFYWGTSATLASYTNVSGGTQTAPGAFTASLTGLSPATTYYFRAWATGDGFVLGSIVSFATSAVTAPPSVTTAAPSGVTTSEATLNGNLAGLGSASSVTVGFLWGTSSTLVGATNVTVGTRTATGAFTSALTGLTPGTTYYFRAWTSGNGFVQGTIQSFTTGASAPSEPTFLGMPAMIGYAVLAVILVAVALLVVLVLMRRRKKAPPESPPENPNP